MSKKETGTYIRIGITSSFFPPDDKRQIFKGKTLLYLVQNLSDWVLGHGALAYVIPSVPQASGVTTKDFVSDLDGLLLQGGSDVAPQTYGETPLKPEWKGDAIRDQYEISLINEFQKQEKPILGVCRGLQILNVALGGTLYQDIATQVPTSANHRNWEIYEQHFHEVSIEPGSFFTKLYPSVDHGRVKVNSIHHQAIKKLAPSLEVQAKALGDGLVEAVKLKSENFVAAVQWHPEFQTSKDSHLLSTEPLLKAFLNRAEERKR